MRRARSDVTRQLPTSVPAPPPPPLLMLLTLVVAAAAAGASTVCYDSGNMTITAEPQDSVIVFGGSVGPAEGWKGARELLADRLTKAGVLAAAGPPRDRACEKYRRDSLAALVCTMKGLKEYGAGAVALGVPLSGAAAAGLARLQHRHRLQVVDAGDVAPPAHRTCRSSQPAVAALADLGDSERLQNINWTLIDSLNRDLNKTVIKEFTPPRCKDNETRCVPLLVSDVTEVEVMQRLVETAELHARVLALGARLPDVLEGLPRPSPPPLLLCDWELDLAEPQLDTLLTNWTRVTPPPCNPSDYLDEFACPFEGRRLVKLVQKSTLERTPHLDLVLYNFHLTAKDLKELGAQGSHAWVTRNRVRADEWVGVTTRRKLRVVVLLPQTGTKCTWNSLGLSVAAQLADDTMDTLSVVTRDTQCSTIGAITQIATELSSDNYNSLTALAGPASGAAFAAVSPLTKVYRLPILAYTLVPVPVSDAQDAHWALLAGGSQHEHAAALGALMQRLGWRRLAVLVDSASRSLLDGDHLRANILLRKELKDGHMDKLNCSMIIQQWVEEAWGAGARVLLLAVEDESVVRAALCAGRGAGAVWLLARTPRSGWLDDTDAECAREAAEGLLAVGPAWEADWGKQAAGVEWTARWRQLLSERQGNMNLNERVALETPEPAAALLYDTLLLWARAWGNATAADANRPEFLESIIQKVIIDKEQLLTGPFNWSDNLVQKGEVRARRATLLVTQWRGGFSHEVARWSNGRLGTVTGLRWPNERAPDDGSPSCVLQPLADLLRGDCHAALATVLTLTALALSAALGGVALWVRWHREHVRLEQVKMRSLPAVDHWEVPRERIVINRKLGVGAFGAVYGGHAELTGGGWTAVAVKTLRPGASMDEKADFLSEAETMKRFEHKNVVRLLGVVTQTEPVCTVMEYLLYADLKGYLLARRHLVGEAEADSEDEVSPRRLTSMALDAARALSYLAEKRYVHRDVAARNCLVSARRQLKLADFGMTRPVLDNDYYRFGRKGMLPVRWMAPESLTQGVFSPASDIWAFGVLLYEMVTFGALPYQGLSNSEVLAHVKRGGTLDLPPGLKPCLKALMKQCWLAAAVTRPPAYELVTYLAGSPRLLTPCLDAPLDALPLTAEPLHSDLQTRWDWGTPASVTTENTYLSDSPPEAACLLPSQ